MTPALDFIGEIGNRTSLSTGNKPLFSSIDFSSEFNALILSRLRAYFRQQRMRPALPDIIIKTTLRYLEGSYISQEN